MDILNNVGSILTGDCLHNKDVPKEIIFGRRIAERAKLGRGRSDETKRKERNINEEFFKAYFTDYQIPGNIYKKLSRTKGAVNEVRVDSIKKVLTKLQRIIDYTPKDDAAKIEENQKITGTVKRTLEFNNKIQSAQGLKILTPSQMFSIFSISLAQINAGNNSEKLKNKIRQMFYSLYRSNKLTKKSIKVWLTLFKHGNSLYEH